jgi:mRNA-degrading endonuclease RelE of RelBE toxin-antitoxin system
MVFHMKTTLMIHDNIMKELKALAARQGKTISELVETALRMMLHPRAEGPPEELPELPTFRGGRPRVDISDRESLYQAMEGR